MEKSYRGKMPLKTGQIHITGLFLDTCLNFMSKHMCLHILFLSFNDTIEDFVNSEINTP